MSGNVLGRRVREIRMDIALLQDEMNSYLNDGIQPPEDVVIELNRAKEALLVALDDRAEYA